MTKDTSFAYFCFIASMVCFQLLNCCMFPDKFQGQSWYTNIRPNLHTRTIVYFHGNSITFQDENTETGYTQPASERKCVRMFDVGKYIVSYQNKERSDSRMYGCIEFVNRSNSIVQLRVSKQTADPEIVNELCSGSNLNLNPWLLVSYTAVRKEFTTCPFSGGYNMKIRYSDGVNHGCNFMDLPMRFESECHKGEGATFDFRSTNCIEEMPMSKLQKAFCITHWRQDGDIVSVLRKSETDELWCLKIPARKSSSEQAIMYLYTDLACVTKANSNLEIVFFKLELDMFPQNGLCADEHSNCYRLPCNNYFSPQCQKSCGKCDPNVYPTACDFPRRIRGDWLVNDRLGVRTINISESRLHMDKVGDFDCINFPDSPLRKTKHFTAVTFFNNGCRPRYTCLGFKRISPNSIGFALSQSRTWPLENVDAAVGSLLCNSENFHGDPSPIQDSYRTYNDVFKPVVAMTHQIKHQSCTLVSSYNFNVTFTNGKICQGSLYQVCSKNYHIRFEFENCAHESSSFMDFTCIGIVDGKYWEKIILIQNDRNEYDTRCIVFSTVNDHRVLVLPSGECDHFSWTYVDAGLRVPVFDLQVEAEVAQCRDITTTTMRLPEAVNDSWKEAYKGDSKNNVKTHEMGNGFYSDSKSQNKENKNDHFTTRKIKISYSNKNDKNVVNKTSISISIHYTTFELLILYLLVLSRLF